MDTLEMLGVALGLATLAGVNLYLTVAVTGLAVHLQWVSLPSNLAQLEILGNPWIIGVAAVLYVLEFFADKVPWIDSVNDAVHTVIRPVGGTLVAVLALGEAHPVVQVIAALLAGGASLTAHAAKSGTRLVANASPEPVSNVVLSVGEDAAVLGGLALIAWNPIVAAALIIFLLIAAWLILPSLLRKVRCTGWLAWRKLNAPSADSHARKTTLPAACELALRRAHASTAPVAWAAVCISGGGPRLPRDHRGFLVRLQGDATHLFFVASRWLRGPVVVQIPMDNLRARRESRFLAESLILESTGGTRWCFHFERSATVVADDTASDINVRSSPAEPTQEPARLLEPVA
ncbi:MAG: hypothetical protein Fur0032_19080 [Terrimicrobiaceae bacterium]